MQVPGSLTSSVVDDAFFILKKSGSRALATQVGCTAGQSCCTSSSPFLISVPANMLPTNLLQGWHATQSILQACHCIILHPMQCN